jgi:hypothetical protein
VGGGAESFSAGLRYEGLKGHLRTHIFRPHALRPRFVNTILSLQRQHLEELLEQPAPLRGRRVRLKRHLELETTTTFD